MQKNNFIFDLFKKGLLNTDPVSFCEENLTLDGKPFRLNSSGYKPFVDIYRYIGITALGDDSKPIVISKGRQIGATTMCAALECFFTCSGLFGTADRAPMRILHCFPFSEWAQIYAKTKLNAMISGAKRDPGSSKKSISVIEAKLDKSAQSNDSLQYKQFINGNHIQIESTGLTGDRLRGRTVDVVFFDECFPYNQNIEVKNGKYKIGKLYEMFTENKVLPLVKTFNEKLEIFEYKKIVNAWKRDKSPLIQITLGHCKIKCTENHRFLTFGGWKKAIDLVPGELIKTSPCTNSNYKRNNTFNNYGFIVVDEINKTDKCEFVYDIEVKDNHNFIATSCSKNNLGGPIVHNCQDISGTAFSNVIKSLTTAKYGSRGIQLYFGTPKQRGSEFWDIWQNSSQQYYYLGCENCNDFFPLYTPGSNEWENIWIEDNLPEDHKSHGFIVKCIHCGCEQDKREAAERGKWVSTNKEDVSKYIGYHLNQLYMPFFTRKDIINEKPENHSINTERAYQNEVLGEFFSGDASPITLEELRTICGDPDRAMRSKILPNENKLVFLGADWGKKIDADQLALLDKGRIHQGQSYSSVVLLSVDKTNQNILNIEFVKLLKSNDPDYKKAFIDEMMRRYSVTLAVGDIGYANDLTYKLQQEHGMKFLGSSAMGTIKNHIQFIDDEQVFPKEIRFEKDYYLSELFEIMKKGRIKIPLKSYDQIGWFLHQCASMEIKHKIDKVGNIKINFCKGILPNDSLMACLNAYLAYKFYISSGFKISNPNNIEKNKFKTNQSVISGYLPGMNPSKRH